MEIKINVDETKFKDVLENELNAFSKEELHEIIRECIIEALHDDDNLKNLFTIKDTSSYYSSTKPSEVMIQAAKSIDLSPAYKEIQDKMINTLKENYHELLEKVMLSMIINGLADDYEFRNRMANDVELIIRNRNCQ